MQGWSTGMVSNNATPQTMIKGATELHPRKQSQHIGAHSDVGKTKRGRKSHPTSTQDQPTVRRPPSIVANQSVSDHDAGATAAEIKDLFTKAMNNRHSAVEELFATGLSANTADVHGNSVLHIASQNGDKRLVKVALRWGADINATNVRFNFSKYLYF